MYTLISDIVSLAMAIWIGNAPGPRPDADVDWTCQDPQWTSGPVVEDGQFKGTVEVDCAFTAVAGGGFPMLKQYFIEDAKKQGNQVHSGPGAETFAGMPSTYFDVTSQVNLNGMLANIRSDVHIATDSASRLV